MSRRNVNLKLREFGQVSLMPPGDPRVLLGQRLRALREEHWPGTPVTQTQLAKALSGDRSASSPLISAWENGSKVPPPSRIEAYASFFATRRSIAEREPRVLRDDELTDEEKAMRQDLLGDLNGLRSAAVGIATGPPPVAPVNLAHPGESLSAPTVISPTWSFPDGNTVTIVC